MPAKSQPCLKTQHQLKLSSIEKSSPTFDLCNLIDLRNKVYSGVFHGHLPTLTYIFAPRRRKAFPITDIELKLMAAAAKMGLSRMPKNG